MKLTLAAVALTVVSFTGVEAGTNRYKLGEVCKFDLEQYCKGFKKTQKKQMKACLETQQANLLPRCQDHYKEAN